jgi:transposase
MSMRPRPWPKVPELTARVARAVAARGPYPLAMRVRDELGELFADAEFAEAFGARGRPGWSPGQLALVTVLQFAENLTDRAAAHRVRYGMDLKYALGLELDDPGFDASVLSEFRTRLVEPGMEEKVLDLLLTALKDRGLVKAGGKQRTDSTRVLAAVRDLNRLELAGETLRAALEALACAAPDWLAQAVPVREWAERYGPRIHSWHPPASTSKREEMTLVYGRDGFTLLEAVHAPDAPAWLRELPGGAGHAHDVGAELPPHRDRGRGGGEAAGEQRPPARQTAAGLSVRHRRPLRPQTGLLVDRLQDPHQRVLRRSRRPGPGCRRPGADAGSRRTAAALDHRHRDHRRHGDGCGNDRTGPSHARRP